MSKRPNIKSSHEKRIERGVQKGRRERDKTMKAAAPAGHIIVEEPVEFSFSRGPVAHDMSPAVERWIAGEAAAQEKHYRRTYREVARLAPLRDRWVKEFFRRISGPRGYSIHAGTRRTLAKREIPRRPRRPWRLSW